MLILNTCGLQIRTNIFAQTNPHETNVSLFIGVCRRKTGRKVCFLHQILAIFYHFSGGGGFIFRPLFYFFAISVKSLLSVILKNYETVVNPLFLYKLLMRLYKSFIFATDNEIHTREP